jgi:hypothetical protein
MLIFSVSLLVYLMDFSIPADVAKLVYIPLFFHNPNPLERLERQGRTWAALKHPRQDWRATKARHLRRKWKVEDRQLSSWADLGTAPCVL